MRYLMHYAEVISLIIYQIQYLYNQNWLKLNFSFVINNIIISKVKKVINNRRGIQYE